LKKNGCQRLISLISIKFSEGSRHLKTIDSSLFLRVTTADGCPAVEIEGELPWILPNVNRSGGRAHWGFTVTRRISNIRTKIVRQGKAPKQRKQSAAGTGSKGPASTHSSSHDLISGEME